MQSPDRDLPVGRELADSLDSFLRGGGNFRALFSPPSQNPPIESASPSEALVPAQGLDNYKERFFAGIDADAVRTADRRIVADLIRDHFRSWKEQTIGSLVWNSDLLVEALQKLTLTDMAQYAKQQFKRWSGEAARVVPNSTEYREARKKSDYWSTMDEVVGPAADPDKTY